MEREDNNYFCDTIIVMMEERYEQLKKESKEYGEERSYEGISEDSGGKDGIYLR